METPTLVCPATDVSQKDTVECEYFLNYDWASNSMWEEFQSYQEVQQEKEKQLNWLKSELAASEVLEYELPF